MKLVRSLSLVLHNLSKIAGVFFISIVIYAVIVLLLQKAGISWAPVEVNDQQFIIYFPFTNAPFLLGDYTWSYISLNFSTFLLYGIFLWLLSKVFLAFMQKKIFIPENRGRLKNFYLFNLYVPLIYIFCLVVLKQEIRDAVIIVFLHLTLSVFIFFMATIFQQGLVLQEEQDQTL
jgi:hypothetical protein